MSLAILLNHWWIGQVAELASDPSENSEALSIIRTRGHSYRTAAAEMGVDFTHLYRVIRKGRASKRLLAKISDLSDRKEGVA